MSIVSVTVNSQGIAVQAKSYRLHAYEVKQAIIEGLNKTVYQARKAERKNIEDALDRPTRFTKASIAVELAKYGDTAPESRVYVMSRMEDILLRLEVGGVDPKGLGITQPGKAYENRYGSIGKGGLRKLLRQDRVFFAVFNGTKGIWRRNPTPTGQPRNARGTGRKRRPVDLLIAFLPRAEYEPQLGFVKVGELVGEKLVKNLQDQLRKRQVST